MKTTKALDNAAKRHGWKSAEDFTDYLSRLIAELKVSGNEATAQDFQCAHDMILSAQLTERL